MDDPDITMEEYARLETEKALRKAIIYNDALASKLGFSSEPTQEDTAYLSLDFTSNHEDLKTNMPYPEDLICCIEDQMAVAAQNINNSTLWQILQSEKLTGPNFTNLHQNLRITLRSENKLVHLEQPFTAIPFPVASQAARDAYEALFDAQNEVACLMLGSMSPDLQRALENYKAYDMI
ncbi:hypothetical protein Tco_0145242 [Tanacetum coccineum]